MMKPRDRLSCPTGHVGARRTLQSWPDLGRNGQAFIIQYRSSLYLRLSPGRA